MSRSNDVLDRMTPRLQTNWDVRAATNFICGGMGSGLLAAIVLMSLQGGGRRLLAALALVLIGAGLTAVWLEIGRPLRALNVYRNAATSWMTREAIIALFIFVSGAAAVLFDWPGAFWLAGLFGFGFLYAQARILYANKGIPAWRHPGVIGVIVTTDLVEGAGLLSVAALYWSELSPFSVLFVSLVSLTCLRFFAWRNYLAGLRQVGSPSGTLKAFDAINIASTWLGHVAPIVIGVVAALLGSPWLLALAGVLAVATGAWFKYVLVCRAAFTQGLALVRTPSHGASTPGAGGKPGWTEAQNL